MKNCEAFIENLGLLNAAAVSIVFVRTREPLRAKDAIREYAYINKREYKEWSMLNGWSSYDKTNSEALPSFDSEKDLAKALDKICNTSGSAVASGGGSTPASTKGFPEHGTYTIMWPHFVLSRVPAILQLILELSVTTVDENKRVLMVVPHHFEVPPELMDVVPIIDFELPSRDEIEEDFEVCLNDITEARRPNFTSEDKAKIINALSGMTTQEIEAANARAIVANRQYLPNIPIDKYIRSILDVKTEALKRSDVLELMPADNMGSVGGLAELKEWIAERKYAFGKEARLAGVDRPRGILVAGPPGGGKSLVAKAVASELGLSLIKFDISRVYSGLVGSSETKVRTTLKMLEAMSPTVCLVDEIDKQVGNQSSTLDSGVSTRILGAILTFMQESKAEIFWVLTANRVQNLPSELVRKGRLDEVFSVLQPAEDEVREIMAIHLRKRKEDPSSIADLEEAVAAARGYVGAEIEAAVVQAKLTAFRHGRKVTGADISKALQNSKPLSVAFADDFTAMSTWAANNARPASLKATVNAAANSTNVVPRTRTRGGRMAGVADAPQPTSTDELDG